MASFCSGIGSKVAVSFMLGFRGRPVFGGIAGSVHGLAINGQVIGGFGM